MRTLWHDIRYGLRMLAANPGFTAVAILSLAIGIGANTSTFSLADALLLRPLPVERPAEIVRLVSTSRERSMGGISYLDYQDFRKHSKALSGIAAYEQTRLGLQADSRSATQLELGVAVDTDFFDVLGVRPSLGRVFRADEDRSPVVLLSDSLWQSQFGRDPGVVGRTVKLSKVDFTIIGVAPARFPGLDLFVHESMYVPFGMLPALGLADPDPLGHRDHLYLEVFGRLAPGRTRAEAQAELQAIAGNLGRAYPETNRGRSVLAITELRARSSNSEDVLPVAMLLAIAGLVLLIACANVANLLLSRAGARSREIAVRLAIGASRRRLFQQLITESLLLAVAGGGAGLLLALFSIDFFASLRLPTTLPMWLVARLDLRVLFFALASSLVSAVIFGVAPALHALRSDLNIALKSGDAALATKGRRVHARDVLVVGQVAVSMMLLLGAGLLTKDFSKLVDARPGFRTDHVLVMALDPTAAGEREPQARSFYQQLKQRLSALPGVRSVALGENIPLGVSGSTRSIAVEGYELPHDQRSFPVQANAVDEDYLPLMQIPIVRGRNFDGHDSASSPLVAIVNQTMARQYWPKGNAVGGHIRMRDQRLEVVGIARNIKYRDVGEAPMPFVYLPFAQQFVSVMTLHVETVRDPAALAAPVLAEIRKLDAGTPAQDVQTLEHFFREGALIGNRIVMQVVLVIGLFGLLLAVTGLYGVIAYSVSRRTREIGIRMAIGADPGGVARLVLRQGMTLTLIGSGIGLALALGASRLMANLLVGVSARDPMVFLTVPPILAAVSLLACYVPARRASRVDPLLALRQD